MPFVYVGHEHMIVVVLLYEFSFDKSVVVRGDRHDSVEHLNDKYRNEEEYILLKIKKDTLPCDLQTSFQIFDYTFQI